MQSAQENLRLSAGQMNKLQNEFKSVCAELDDLKRRFQDLQNSNKKMSEYESKIALLSQEVERLNSVVDKKNKEVNSLGGKLGEIDLMNKNIGNLQEKITRLVSENTDINGEMSSAQENLRLSANQNQKIMKELNDYKQKIDQNSQENNLLKQKINKLFNENSSLNDEVSNAQESVRLSSAAQSKMAREIHEYREQITINTKETETYKIKIQKLFVENTSLGDEVRGAQENIRLSSGTISKLTNELKQTCSENEELKRQLKDTTNVNKKLPEYESKIAMLSQEIERLNGVIDKKNAEVRGFKEGEVEAENMAQQVRQLSVQMKRITGENEGLYSEVSQGQEQIRLSNNQISKLKTEVDTYRSSMDDMKRKTMDVSSSKNSEYEAKIAMFSQEIERLNVIVEKKNNEVSQLNKKLHDIDGMNKSIGDLQGKIKRLANENYEMEEEVRAAQENVRLSSNQNAKMLKEINDYKQRIDGNDRENEMFKKKINNLVSENTNLESEVRNAQESMRLSSATQAKLQRELMEMKSRITDNNTDSETFRLKIQKLSSENNALNDEFRGVQENLRLSSGTISKLTNELKMTCKENEELKKKIEEIYKYKSKCMDYEEKIILLSAEIQRLRNVSSSSHNETEGTKKKLLEYEAK